MHVSTSFLDWDSWRRFLRSLGQLLSLDAALQSEAHFSGTATLHRYNSFKKQRIFLAIYAVDALTKGARNVVPDTRYSTFFQPTQELRAGVKTIFENIVRYGGEQPGSAAIRIQCETQDRCNQMEAMALHGLYLRPPAMHGPAPQQRVLNAQNFAFYAAASFISASLGSECAYARHKRHSLGLPSGEPGPITLNQRALKKKPAMAPAVPVPAAVPGKSCAKIDAKCKPTADKATGSTFCSPTKKCPPGQMNDPNNLSVCIKHPTICYPGQQKTATGCEDIKCSAGKSLHPVLIEATISGKKEKIWMRGCGPKEFDAKVKTAAVKMKMPKVAAPAQQKGTPPAAAVKKVKTVPATGKKVAGGTV
ncbi:hypothetical protein DFH27DRAFT_645121 [Peziza echinospora]|nr:hypothetical protein DFH27DRAFT_645121 [Peziza echinospora]